MSHIFISYSRLDKDYVDKLCQALSRNRFDVWIDRRMNYGDRWEQILVEKIDGCSVFLAVITKNSSASEWVSNEILYAIEMEKRIYGLWLEGKLPLSLKSRHVIDLRGKPKGSLPDLDFYRQLKEFAARRPIDPKQMAEIAKNRAQLAQRMREIKQAAPEIKLQPPEQNEAESDEIQKWDKYRRPGNNDYYGMTMLALALEAAGTYLQHVEAIMHLRRAFKLEPRIIEKGWMNENHNWDEDQHARLERIIKDPKFWK